jgi:hypothetical protein
MDPTGEATPVARDVSRRTAALLALRRWIGVLVGPRKVRVALAAYLVTIVFGVGFLVARLIATDESRFVAVGAAVVLALPLAIAFVGDRVTSVKFPGGEVVFAAVTIPVASTIPSDALNPSDPVAESASNPDSRSALASRLRQLIEAPGAPLLQVDLRDGDYWWPTRLYLLAALLKDYTDVQRLVFVRGGPGREYVGMARLSATCRRIENALPGLDAAYADARLQAVDDVIRGATQPSRFGTASQAATQPVTPRAPVDEALVVEFVAEKWPMAVESHRLVGERDIEQRVDRPWLASIMGDDLRWSAVEVDGSPGGPLLQYRLITAADDFIALTIGKKLEGIVSRSRLATSVATTYLEWRLAGTG